MSSEEETEVKTKKRFDAPDNENKENENITVEETTTVKESKKEE